MITLLYQFKKEDLKVTLVSLDEFQASKTLKKEIKRAYGARGEDKLTEILNDPYLNGSETRGTSEPRLEHSSPSSGPEDQGQERRPDSPTVGKHPEAEEEEPKRGRQLRANEGQELRKKERRGTPRRWKTSSPKFKSIQSAYESYMKRQGRRRRGRGRQGEGPLTPLGPIHEEDEEEGNESAGLEEPLPDEIQYGNTDELVKMIKEANQADRDEAARQGKDTGSDSDSESIKDSGLEHTGRGLVPAMGVGGSREQGIQEAVWSAQDTEGVADAGRRALGLPLVPDARAAGIYDPSGNHTSGFHGETYDDNNASPQGMQVSQQTSSEEGRGHYTGQHPKQTDESPHYHTDYEAHPTMHTHAPVQFGTSPTSPQEPHPQEQTDSSRGVTYSETATAANIKAEGVPSPNAGHNTELHLPTGFAAHRRERGGLAFREPEHLGTGAGQHHQPEQQTRSSPAQGQSISPWVIRTGQQAYRPVQGVPPPGTVQYYAMSPAPNVIGSPQGFNVVARLPQIQPTSPTYNFNEEELPLITEEQYHDIAEEKEDQTEEEPQQPRLREFHRQLLQKADRHRLQKQQEKEREEARRAKAKKAEEQAEHEAMVEREVERIKNIDAHTMRMFREHYEEASVAAQQELALSEQQNSTQQHSPEHSTEQTVQHTVEQTEEQHSSQQHPEQQHSPEQIEHGAIESHHPAEQPSEDQASTSGTSGKTPRPREAKPFQNDGQQRLSVRRSESTPAQASSTAPAASRPLTADELRHRRERIQQLSNPGERPPDNGQQFEDDLFSFDSSNYGESIRFIRRYTRTRESRYWRTNLEGFRRDIPLQRRVMETHGQATITAIFSMGDAMQPSQAQQQGTQQQGAQQQDTQDQGQQRRGKHRRQISTWFQKAKNIALGK